MSDKPLKTVEETLNHAFDMGKEVSQVEKSLRDMYELGKQHGYEEAIRVIRLHQLSEVNHD